MAKDNFAKFQNKVESMIANVEGLAGLSVEVGLPDDRIHTPSGMSLAKLGAIHEFGLGNVPERSFLRGAVRDGEGKIRKAFKTISKKAVNGEDPKALMENLALFGQGLVQEYISAGISPPNTPQTIKRKGSSVPLISTGEMRQSIIGVVVGD